MLERLKKLRPAVGPLILAFPYLVRAIQLLGDVDTACAIAGKAPDQCGSSAVTQFILTPPVWMITLSVGAALAWFWHSERNRERPYVQKLDKLHTDFWELSAAYHDNMERIDKLAASFDDLNKRVVSLFDTLNGIIQHRQFERQEQYAELIQGVEKEIERFRQEMSPVTAAIRAYVEQGSFHPIPQAVQALETRMAQMAQEFFETKERADYAFARFQQMDEDWDNRKS